MKYENAQRAVRTYAAMQRYFRVQDGTPLYHQAYSWTGSLQYAYVWEFSRALVGTLALAGVPRELLSGTDYVPAVHECADALEYYWNSRAKPPAYDSYVVAHGGGDRYYDDNAWVALALIQQYRMGLSSSVDRARQLFALAQSGWDANSGGVFWVQQGTGVGRSNHDRGAGATAGNAEVGLHLVLLGDSTLPLEPTRMVNWVHDQLDASGLYYNLVRQDRSIDTNLWSYNQGVMIGARVLQFQLTSESRFLHMAAAIATKGLNAFGNFQAQPPAFNAMLFQNMLMLYSFASNELQTTMLERMESYAGWAWENARGEDDLFYFDDVGRAVVDTQLPAQLRDQGAMTQLYALLAWPPQNYCNLT